MEEQDEILEELQRAREAKGDELRLEHESQEERNRVYDGYLEILRKIRERERELYFSLETPKPLELEGLNLEELQALLTRTQKQLTACRTTELEDPAEKAALDSRFEILAQQQIELYAEIDRLQELSYAPTPDGPPAYEPRGYSSQPGFVKSRPENNAHYVAQFRDHPWFPIIEATHEALEELIPGYNISQIKEKFGGLRYYFSYPDPIPLKESWGYSTPERVKAQAEKLIARAEGWVEGFEHARRLLLEEQG